MIMLFRISSLLPAGLTRKDVREENVSFTAAQHSIFSLINELWALDEVSHQYIEGLEIGCLRGDHLKHCLLDLPFLATDLAWQGYTG